MVISEIDFWKGAQTELERHGETLRWGGFLCLSTLSSTLDMFYPFFTSGLIVLLKLHRHITELLDESLLLNLNPSPSCALVFGSHTSAVWLSYFTRSYRDTTSSLNLQWGEQRCVHNEECNQLNRLQRRSMNTFQLKGSGSWTERQGQICGDIFW